MHAAAQALVTLFYRLAHCGTRSREGFAADGAVGVMPKGVTLSTGPVNELSTGPQSVVRGRLRAPVGCKESLEEAARAGGAQTFLQEIAAEGGSDYGEAAAQYADYRFNGNPDVEL